MQTNNPNITWERFQDIETDKPLREAALNRNGRPFHVLFPQQFTRAQFEEVFATATAIRRLHKSTDGKNWLACQLAHKRVMLLFTQPSTRTVESFAAGTSKLGMEARTIQDLSTSSFAKGETVEDAVRVLSSYFDAIVIRSEDDQFTLRATWALNQSKREIPIISGGFGAAQHVTQSLLDTYTLAYSCQTLYPKAPTIDNKTIMVVCDLKRNRAARSLLYILSKFQNPRIILVTPPGMADDDELIPYISQAGARVVFRHNLTEAVEEFGKETHAIYMTRNQKEYKTTNIVTWNEEDFWLHWSLREHLNPKCIVMHPLPRVKELPAEWDVWEQNMIWRQTRNGMWIRAAIFASIFQVDGKIREHAEHLKLIP